MFDKDVFNKVMSVPYVHIEEESASFYFDRVSVNTLDIYFEKSNGFTDWKNNFRFPARPYKSMDQGHVWFCHRGFLKVWKVIKPYIEEQLLDQKIRHVRVIGYSHGAAIAQLCYEYIKYNRPTTITVEGIGFGSPKVFWGFARKSVKKRFEDFVIVRHGRDLVTYVPPLIFGYRHLGKVIKVGKSRGPIKDHYPERYGECVDELLWKMYGIYGTFD